MVLKIPSKMPAAPQPFTRWPDSVLTSVVAAASPASQLALAATCRAARAFVQPRLPDNATAHALQRAAAAVGVHPQRPQVTYNSRSAWERVQSLPECIDATLYFDDMFNSISTSPTLIEGVKGAFFSGGALGPDPTQLQLPRSTRAVRIESYPFAARLGGLRLNLGLRALYLLFNGIEVALGTLQFPSSLQKLAIFGDNLSGVIETLTLPNHLRCLDLVGCSLGDGVAHLRLNEGLQVLNLLDNHIGSSILSLRLPQSVQRVQLGLNAIDAQTQAQLRVLHPHVTFAYDQGMEASDWGP